MYKSTSSSGILSTTDDGSASSSSSLGRVFTIHAVSAWKTKILMDLSAVFLSILDSSKHTTTLDSTVTKEDRLSGSTSSPGEFFTTSGGLIISFPQGLTVYTSSDMSTPAFSNYSSYNTDNASPASPSQPPLQSQKKQTLTEKPTSYTTVSDLAKLSVFSETSFTRSEESSTRGGYQETPTSLESAVSTIFSDSSNPIVPYDTFSTTQNISHFSPSGPSDFISTSVVTGQTFTAFLEASTVYTAISDLFHLSVSAVSSSTTVNGSPVFTSSSGELSSTNFVSRQTTVFMEKLTLYATISNLSSSTVSIHTFSTTPSGGPAFSSGSALLPSKESSGFTTNIHSFNTTDLSDVPDTTADLSALSSSNPIHSSTCPVTSGQMFTTLVEDSTLLVTSSYYVKLIISTFIPSATDNISPSAFNFSSTTRDTSGLTAITLSGGFTIFQSGSVSSDNHRTTVSVLLQPQLSLASPPGQSLTSSAITTSDFSPSVSSISLGSTILHFLSPIPL